MHKIETLAPAGKTFAHVFGSVRVEVFLEVVHTRAIHISISTDASKHSSRQEVFVQEALTDVSGNTDGNLRASTSR